MNKSANPSVNHPSVDHPSVVHPSVKIDTSPDGQVTATYNGKTLTANFNQSAIINANIIRLLKELMQPKLDEPHPSDPMYHLFERTRLISYDYRYVDGDFGALGQGCCEIDTWAERYVLTIDNIEFTVISSYDDGYRTCVVQTGGEEVFRSRDGYRRPVECRPIYDVMKILNVNPDLVVEFMRFFLHIVNVNL